ncbi:hypothetical protein ACFOD4_20615 [Pseudoroseomonas globiformis]|uniref:Transposase n=1 Tax=Teichococcus globiformis TaxID=2307229 RepID=A0ABV7G470_9PROT
MELRVGGDQAAGMRVWKPYPSMSPMKNERLSRSIWTSLPGGSRARRHRLCEVFNGLRYVIKTGAPWRWMPMTCRNGSRLSEPQRRFVAVLAILAIL